MGEPEFASTPPVPNRSEHFASVPEENTLSSDIFEDIEFEIQLWTTVLETGDLDKLERWFTRYIAGLMRKCNKEQKRKFEALRVALLDARQREAAAGGPGSLFNPNHPHVLGIMRSRELVRMPFDRMWRELAADWATQSGKNDD